MNADIPAYALVVGVPAKQIGWMSEHGERLALPLSGTARATCPASGATYTLLNQCVSREVSGECNS